jgi:hypothetical protein
MCSGAFSMAKHDFIFGELDINHVLDVNRFT